MLGRKLLTETFGLSVTKFLLIANLSSLILTSCTSNKLKPLSPKEFATKTVKYRLAEKGYEGNTIQAEVGPGSSITVSKEGELLAFKGKIWVTFDYRTKGSSEPWLKGADCYEAEFKDGKWDTTGNPDFPKVIRC